MQSNERELGQVVVKTYLVTPAGFIMAVLTLLTLLALVYIIELVTVTANTR